MAVAIAAVLSSLWQPEGNAFDYNDKIKILPIYFGLFYILTLSRRRREHTVRGNYSPQIPSLLRTITPLQDIASNLRGT